MRLTRATARTCPPAPQGAGFTLVELLIAIALLSVLLSLAAPSFTTWIRNAQVRTVAEALQNGVRMAQAEAVRRNRQAVFFLTADTPGLGATAQVDGSNWVVRWIPQPGDTVTAAAPALEPFVRGGALADVAAGVTIEGPAAVCFNPVGRRVAATAAATGVAGAACTATAAQFDIKRADGARPLRVTVALGGQVRMCDPSRALSASPDGC